MWEMTAERMQKSQYEYLMELLRVREEHLARKGLRPQRPIFDIGQEVGFFYEAHPKAHGVGTIMAQAPKFVTIWTRKGKVHQVSPFALFHLE